MLSRWLGRLDELFIYTSRESDMASAAITVLEELATALYNWWAKADDKRDIQQQILRAIDRADYTAIDISHLDTVLAPLITLRAAMYGDEDKSREWGQAKQEARLNLTGS